MSINDQIADELQWYPRGDLAQNTFRSAYQDLRAHSLATGVGTAEDARRQAALIVKMQFPGFEPTVLRGSSA